MKKTTKYILYAGIAIIGFMVFRKYLPMGLRSTGATVDVPIPMSGEGGYHDRTLAGRTGISRIQI